MKTRMFVLAAFVMAALFATACAPKVMTQTRFTSNTKIAKLLTRKDGETFSRYLQICDVDANGAESNCKETMILDKINNAIPFK